MTEEQRNRLKLLRKNREARLAYDGPRKNKLGLDRGEYTLEQYLRVELQRMYRESVLAETDKIILGG